MGHGERAIRQIGDSVDVTRRLEMKELLALTSAHYATTLVAMCRFDEAWESGQEALQIAAELGDLAKRGEVLTSVAVFYHLRNGDVDAAVNAAVEGGTVAARIGDLFHQCSGLLFRGGVAILRGEYEHAIALQTQVLGLASQLGNFAMFLSPPALSCMITAYLEMGQLQEAQESADRLAPMEPMAGAGVWADLGFAALAEGNLARAEEVLQKGLSQPSLTWMLERPRLLAGRALVALARGEIDMAAGCLQEARQFADERQMLHVLPLVDLVDAQIRAARGDASAALTLFQRSAQGAGRLHARGLVWRAHAGAARMLTSLGRPAEADEEMARAHAMIDEIASLFADASLAASFRNKVTMELNAPARPDAATAL
jgi:tetratricopeptide (TPR) repeat protein